MCNCEFASPPNCSLANSHLTDLKTRIKSVMHGSFSVGKILRKNGYRSGNTLKKRQPKPFVNRSHPFEADGYNCIPVQSKLHLKTDDGDKEQMALQN